LVLLNCVFLLLFCVVKASQASYLLRGLVNLVTACGKTRRLVHGESAAWYRVEQTEPGPILCAVANFPIIVMPQAASPIRIVFLLIGLLTRSALKNI
jgi:hypothetical protein